MKRILLTAGGRPPINYLKAVQALGAEATVADANSRPEDFEGLLLCGGGDPEPALYGEKNQGSYGVDPERDRLELTCVHSFLKSGKPILGICRGAQMLNVAFGGNLTQHLSTAQMHIAPGEERWHDLRTEGMLRKLYGRRMRVNSSHHQGILRLGRGLEPMGMAPDGLIEGLAHPRLPVWGVQFHPERMDEGWLLFEAFLKFC